MALTIANSGKGATILFVTTSQTQLAKRPFNVSFSTRTSTMHVVVSAAKKVSSRVGKFDSKNKRSSVTTTQEDAQGTVGGNGMESVGTSGVAVVDYEVDDGYFLPELPGDKPDLFEGSQWDWLGFFGEYMWAFGIVFALIACGIAVATYNEGATDFKETPAYKESVQTQELLEGPEESNPDVFESNPTEVAPSLE